MSATTRRRLARRSLAALLAAAALTPSAAGAMSAYDSPALDGSDAVVASHGRSDAAWGTGGSAPPSPDRSDAAWRTADEPATPTAFTGTVSDDGSDLVPVLPGAIVLVLAAGGAGFTLVRMNGRRPGLSH